MDFSSAYKSLCINVLPEFFYVVCNSNNSNLPSKTVNCYPGVVNLSDTILSQAETSPLAKGLTFVDTPSKPDLGTIAEDLNKFHLSIKRHLALPKFFHTPSNWNPPCPMIIDHMNMINTEEILSPNIEKNTPKRYNLTKEERSAKHSLFENKNFIIKKADKGSAVVVQNKSGYLKEGLRQLSDRKLL